MKNKKALVLATIFLVGFSVLFFLLVQPKKVTENVAPSDLVVPEVQESTPQIDTSSGSIRVLQSGIVTQMGNDLKLKFKIKNEKDLAHSGIKYYINLHKYDEVEPQRVFIKYPIDRVVYPESLTIDGAGEMEKEISYSAPKYLVGKYHVSVEFFQADSGFYLDRADVGDFELSNSETNFLEVDPNSCYLTVVADKVADKQYGLLNGVDVAATENLLAHCKITNHYTEKITISPQFVNYYRHDFLEKTVPQVEKNLEKITLNAKESKVITLSVPYAKKPQAYDAKLFFNNNEGVKASNAVSFHYVLAGESAIVQTITADKEAYTSGETANVSVMWSESANNFANSRLGGTTTTDLTMSIGITNGEGESCVDETQRVALHSDDLVLETPLTITKECSQPTVSAIIYDKNNQVLDEKSHSFSQSASKKQSYTLPDKNNVLRGVGFLIMIMALVVVIVLRKKMKKKNLLIIFLAIFLVGLGVFFYANIKKGQADSGVGGCDDYSVGGGCVVYCVCGNRHCSGGCESTAARSTYTSTDVHPSSPLCMWGSPSTNAASIPFPVGKYGAASRVSWRCWSDTAEEWNSATCYASRAEIPAPIITLTASPSTLRFRGGNSTLIWTVQNSNATSCTASGGWSGQKSVNGGNELVANIRETTAFSLECVNDVGRSTKSATVTVDLPPAPALTFTANPTTLKLNSNSNTATEKSSKLTWKITNYDDACYPNGCTCSASQSWSGTKDATGSSQDVTIASYGNHQYTLGCANNKYSQRRISKMVSVNASCNAKTWYDACTKSCGTDAQTCHRIGTTCQVSSCASIACNPPLSACPVSGEIREVR